MITWSNDNKPINLAFPKASKLTFEGMLAIKKILPSVRLWKTLMAELYSRPNTKGIIVGDNKMMATIPTIVRMIEITTSLNNRCISVGLWIVRAILGVKTEAYELPININPVTKREAVA